ncbi:prepilin-type N-terminal cleavage/methylation domain-containing protein [Stutzerimonas kunmingensis]|jgi:MSHA pilin protein MshD|uniref:prepilin-type N-terminal cleavage/methylation domain-containing protein n=1 Tax=Stutzerimonas kunmingensis TaxID=1211807 RepID=UPI001CD13167|nr:prepilin-type N-terminal cleavage/methylation domain-containing protein [Stutzerimonas kunmingensis]|tara:strand:- start:312 stop:809 length:498 start_codon:yes stop_codon:yes gene_type:complete
MPPLAARHPSPALATPRKQHGMTLVELVITIVIIGIAAAALFSAMATITARSADPMLRQQSLSIAEAYMEEILLQNFMQTPQPAGCGRACFNDVRDYHGLDQSPRDPNDNALQALSSYRVAVAVSGPAPLNEVSMLRVRVTVADPAGQPLVLEGYRSCYGEAGCP